MSAGRIATLATAAAGLLVTACVSVDEFNRKADEQYLKPTVDAVARLKSKVIGHPSGEAFAVLLYPTQQEVIADKRVYVWDNPGCRIRLFAEGSDQQEIITNLDWRETGLQACYLMLEGPDSPSKVAERAQRLRDGR